MSLLNGEAIQAENLVLGDDVASYRASTYDLRVGQVFPATGGETAGLPYTLAPGGMVRVVSIEAIRLPCDRTAHVLLKNGLGLKCLLAINIGVIDPLFEGPVSSTLINFGRHPVVIKQYDHFLRVSFHECPPSALAKPFSYTRNEYIYKTMLEVQAYAGDTFLDMEETTEKVARRVLGSYKEWLTIGTPVAALVLATVLALVTILVPLGAAYADHYIASRYADNAPETKKEKELEDKLDAESRQIQELTTQIKYLQTQEGAGVVSSPRHPK